jgi:hypothetical protein
MTDKKQVWEVRDSNIEELRYTPKPREGLYNSKLWLNKLIKNSNIGELNNSVGISIDDKKGYTYWDNKNIEIELDKKRRAIQSSESKKKSI